jgi:hypothetical protein
MKLMKGKTTLYFDRILKIKNGFGVAMNTAVESNKLKSKTDINNLHKVLGHCGQQN